MWLAPCYKITIGDWRVTRLVSQTVRASLGTASVARARLVLDASRLPAEPIAAVGDALRSWEGYRGVGLWNVFTGEVVDVRPGLNFEIVAADGMELVRRTRLVRTFVDVSPAEVVEAIVREAGVRVHRLSSRPMPRRHHFVLTGEDGLTAIRKVDRAWSLGWVAQYDPDTGFYWGPWEESPRYEEGELLTLAVGRNLEELSPSDHDTGYARTISLPYVRPGHRVRLEDARYWRRSVSARVERVEHTRTETEVSTWIEWRVLA